MMRVNHYAKRAVIIVICNLLCLMGEGRRRGYMGGRYMGGGEIWEGDMGGRYGREIWEGDMGGRYGREIWEGDMGGRVKVRGFDAKGEDEGKRIERMRKRKTKKIERYPFTLYYIEYGARGCAWVIS